MSGARGQDGDVAGGYFQLLAAVAAEADTGVATGDAEHFMHGGVVVQIIVDAVAPHRAPAIGAEQSLDGFFRVVVRNVDRALVDQERHRIVRNEPVVFEDKSEGLDAVADDGHAVLGRF
jgi:hypothetical protein